MSFTFNVSRFTPKTIANAFVLAASFTYIAVFSWLSIQRHASLHSGGYDLGIFDQVVWNSARGHLFENSIMVDSPSFLGHHFSPILLALVPIYTVWNDPRALLVTQTIALALAALPIYWFARKQIGYGLACVVLAAYFLYPPLHGVNLFEFHEIALAVPLLAFALFFLLRRLDLPFLVCLVLAMLCKEEVAFTAAAIGLYILFIQRRRTFGLALTLASLAWGLAVVQFIIPSFHDASGGSGYFFTYLYGYLGSSVSEIVTTAVTQPGLVLQHLFVAPKIEYVLQLLVPLAFLPLLGPEIFALSLPTLAIILISDYPFAYSIRYQYSAALIPFLFFATVVGLGRLLHWRMPTASQNSRALTNRAAYLGVLLLMASLANYYFQADAPLARRFNVQDFAMTPHIMLGYQFLNQIPPDARVMVEANLAPQLSHREYDYEPSQVPDLRKIDYILADTSVRQHYDPHTGVIWQRVLPLPFFETIAEQDGYIFKKRVDTPIVDATNTKYGDRITLLGYQLLAENPAKRGDTVPLTLVWRADAAISDRYGVFVHLYDQHGHLWQQDNGEPGRGWFRTDTWQSGDTTPDGYELALPAYMPPGDYGIGVKLCTVDGDQCLNAISPSAAPLGTEPIVATLHVGNGYAPPGATSISIQHPLNQAMGDLELLGFDSDLNSLSPGGRTGIGLYWRAPAKPLTDLEIALQLRDSTGHVAFEQSSRPAANTYPTIQWKANDVVLDWHDLNLPATLNGGDYDLYSAVRDATTKTPVAETKLASVNVSSVPRQFTEPAVAHPLEATFGDKIKLLGYNLALKQKNLRLTLIWQALKPIDRSYTVFTHLLDADGKIVAQQDSIPLQGARPTTGWLPGEYITDNYTLELTAGNSVEPNTIEIGLYDATTGARLTANDAKDHLVITNIQSP